MTCGLNPTVFISSKFFGTKCGNVAECVGEIVFVAVGGKNSHFRGSRIAYSPGVLIGKYEFRKPLAFN